MVKLNVENRRCEAQLRQETNTPIYEEMIVGISQLIILFKNEAIKLGNSKENVNAACEELIDVIKSEVENSLLSEDIIYENGLS